MPIQTEKQVPPKVKVLQNMPSTATPSRSPGRGDPQTVGKNLSNPDRQQNKKDAHTHVCPAKGEYPSILHFSNVPFSISRPDVKDLFPLFGTDPVLVAISGERDRAKDRLLKPWFGIYV